MFHVLVCTEDDKLQKLPDLLGEEFNVEFQKGAPRRGSLLKVPDCVIADTRDLSTIGLLATLAPEQPRTHVVGIALVDSGVEYCSLRGTLARDVFQRRILDINVLASRVDGLCHERARLVLHDEEVARRQTESRSARAAVPSPSIN